VCGQQITGLASREGHQETVTETVPAESGAIAEKTEVSRSMIRPGFEASRSVTTQVTEAPVATLRTTTVVPIGSDGLAHCPARHEYHVARPEALDIGRVVVVGAGAAVVGVGAATRTAVAGGVVTTGAGIGAGAAGAVVVVVVGAGTLLPTSMIRRRCRCCWPCAALAGLTAPECPADAVDGVEAPSRSSGRAIMATTAPRATA
jgi:hypothetical protein